MNRSHAGRRVVSIPGLFAIALVLVVTSVIWLPLTVVADLLRGRFRLPMARLLCFAVCWAWLESAGVIASFVFLVVGRGRDERLHFALQRWWAARLLGALKATCGIAVSVENAQCLSPGPVVMFARHASLADSLVSAYVITSVARMNPHYVLKRELLVDPCLDVVGQRLPNHFLDRGAVDAEPELLALEAITSRLDSGSVGVIFPEGTRANPVKRERAIAKISSVDAERAARLGPLRHLLPVRPAGAAAMLRGAPNADVVFAWHVGFEGLDTFGGILKALSRRMEPIRFVMNRVSRSDVASPARDNMIAFTEWLDTEWHRLDREVDVALAERRNHG